MVFNIKDNKASTVRVPSALNEEQFAQINNYVVANPTIPEGKISKYMIFKVENNTVVFDIETATLLLIKDTKKEFNNAIQKHLDTKAQELRYDNIMSARSYAGYDNPFQAEALKLSQWASRCWVVAGQIETDVSNGTRTMPTVDEVLSELPKY